MAGRPPSPIAVRKAKGNPGGQSLDPIVPAPPAGVLPLPKKVHRDSRALSYWRHYEKTLADGHMNPVDAVMLGELCLVLARIDRTHEQFEEEGEKVVVETGGGEKTEPRLVQNPLLVSLRADIDLMRKLHVDLCIAPSQRNKVIPGYGGRGGTMREGVNRRRAGPESLLDG
jgi:hypothetical protein